MVISNSPAHWTDQRADLIASIVLQFSKPMDTNSVQSAFSIEPGRRRHVRLVGGTTTP